MSKRRCQIVFTLLAIVMLAGCASNGPERHIDDPTSSLVFAYIDMENAPTSLDYASLHQVKPKTEYSYWSMETKEGLIFNQYLPEGAYQMAQFGGSGFFSGTYEYSFPKYGRNATAVRIDKPGIYFLGAYRYTEAETGFFEAGKFSIEPAPSPAEPELLKELAEMNWVKGTQWEERIRERLAELGE